MTGAALITMLIVQGFVTAAAAGFMFRVLRKQHADDNRKPANNKRGTQNEIL